MNKENKEIIVPFMGGLPCDRCEDCGMIKFGDYYMFVPKYHEDWNALMPVVEKISNMAVCDENSGTHDSPSYGAADDLLYEYINSDIRTIYLAVIKFIKWYNTQQQ